MYRKIGQVKSTFRLRDFGAWFSQITKTENAIFLSNTVIQLIPFVFKCQQALIRLQKGSQGSSQAAAPLSREMTTAPSGQEG